MKKIIVFVLACVFACSMLAACGGSSGDQTQSGATEAAKADGGVIKIGAIVNSSGWFAAFDLNNQLELETYVQYINENGGVEIGGANYTLELVEQDGKSDFEGVRAASIAVADEDVDLILATDDFWVAGSIDVLEGAGVPYMSAHVDFEPGYWAGSTRALSGATGGMGTIYSLLAENAEINPDAKKLLLVLSDDGLCEPKYEFIKSINETYGWGYEIVADYITFAADTTDMSAVATQAMTYDAEVVYVLASPVASTGLAKEMKNQGATDTIFLMDPTKSSDIVIALLGEEYADNIIHTGQDFDKSVEGLDEFTAWYEYLKTKQDAETVANYSGYFINMLKESLEIYKATGTTDPQAFMDYVAGASTIDCMYGEALVGGSETYGTDANRAIFTPVPVSKIENGKGEFIKWIDVPFK